jgi:transposase
MRNIPHLSLAERKQLIRAGRRTGNAGTAFRYLILATLGAGHSRNEVARRLSCAVSTVVRTAARFVSGGLGSLHDRRIGNGATKVDRAFLDELRVVLDGTPQDSGWERPTWTRELLALEMNHRSFSLVAACTMGRALVDIGARRGNPKPVVLCPWPRRRRQHVLATLLRLVTRSTDDDPVFYADEVDIHFNPKIGLDWMNRGHQRVVITPGKNQKHYVAGALHATTRKLTWVDGERKNSLLFCNLLDQLLLDYPKAERIHVILDNYIIHASKLTQRHVAKLGGRIVLHFLPPYCPDHNRIERLWQDLHANVTRNHRCKTMTELLQRVISFLVDYNFREHCKPSLRTAIPVAA